MARAIQCETQATHEKEIGSIAEKIGTVVTRSDGSVDPTPLLSCPTLGHIPAVTDPSSNQLAQKRYASCVAAVSKRNV
jgi:septum site-determining protein MinD